MYNDPVQAALSGAAVSKCSWATSYGQLSPLKKRTSAVAPGRSRNGCECYLNKSTRWSFLQLPRTITHTYRCQFSKRQCLSQQGPLYFREWQLLCRDLDGHIGRNPYFVAVACLSDSHKEYFRDKLFSTSGVSVNVCFQGRYYCRWQISMIPIQRK